MLCLRLLRSVLAVMCTMTPTGDQESGCGWLQTQNMCFGDVLHVDDPLQVPQLPLQVPLQLPLQVPLQLPLQPSVTIDVDMNFTTHLYKDVLMFWKENKSYLYNTHFYTFHNKLFEDVAWFYEKHYSSVVPVYYNAMTGLASPGEGWRDHVYSVKCIVDLLRLAALYPDIVVFDNKDVLSHLDYFFKHVQSNDVSVYLFEAYSQLSDLTSRNRAKLLQERLCDFLSSAESRWLRSKTVASLASLFLRDEHSLSLTTRDQMFHMLMWLRQEFQLQIQESRNTSTLLFLNTVFDVNEYSQSLYYMLQLATRVDRFWLPWLQDFRQELVQHILSVQAVIFKHKPLETLPTLFLAVLFECLSFLSDHRLTEFRYQVFTFLLQARRGNFGLFYFQDSPVARLDVTSHIMSTFIKHILFTDPM